MNKLLLYQNAEQKLFVDLTDGIKAIDKVKEYYDKIGSNLEEISKNYSIRIYVVKILKNKELEKNAEIISISNTGQKIDKTKAIIWTLEGKYKNIKINITAYDKKDITYNIWETLEFLLNNKNENIIKDFNFKMVVKTKVNKKYTEKQKLILFFSKKENWGKLWSYDAARKAMQKEGLEMSGRGIEGERPREFRYDLGYPFITSEQSKEVPDGYFKVDYPFPNQPRNERRNANINLIKEDWSELNGILKKNPKILRCYECGLFENETNKIGQKTVFQKGHLKNHLSGGNVSRENIAAICKYCNSEQKDIYSYNTETGKKIYHIIPFLKNKPYQEKIIAFIYLLKHLKKEHSKDLIKKELK